MMGSTEDPKNGKAVASAVFGAVTVYAVSLLNILLFCFALPVGLVHGVGAIQTDFHCSLSRSFLLAAASRRCCTFELAGEVPFRFSDTKLDFRRLDQPLLVVQTALQMLLAFRCLCNSGVGGVKRVLSVSILIAQTCIGTVRIVEIFALHNA